MNWPIGTIMAHRDVPSSFPHVICASETGDVLFLVSRFEDIAPAGHPSLRERIGVTLSLRWFRHNSEHRRLLEFPFTHLVAICRHPFHPRLR
jgi:hypothetical protein